MKKPEVLKGHLSMLSANVLWGCMAPVSKAVLLTGMVSSVALTTFRMVGAAIAFWIASIFTRKEQVSSQDLVKLFFASLFGVLLNQGSFIFGVSMTSPIDASIVTTTTPIIAMIIAALYLKEPITGKKVIGIATGATGALLLILSSQTLAASKGHSSNLSGDLLCLLAQISFSFYIVFFKDLVGRYTPATIMKWMFTYASICCIPFSYSSVESINFSILPVADYFYIAYIVFGGTFLSYLFLPIGQKVLRPTVACMYNYIQPILASVVAVLWGMDTFGLVKGIAVGLVFLGVYIVTQSKSKVQMDAENDLYNKTEIDQTL